MFLRQKQQSRRLHRNLFGSLNAAQRLYRSIIRWTLLFGPLWTCQTVSRKRANRRKSRFKSDFILLKKSLNHRSCRAAITTCAIPGQRTKFARPCRKRKRRPVTGPPLPLPLSLRGNLRILPSPVPRPRWPLRPARHRRRG